MQHSRVSSFCHTFLHEPASDSSHPNLSYDDFKSKVYSSSFSEDFIRYCNLIRLHYIPIPVEFVKVLHFYYFGNDDTITGGDQDGKQALIHAANATIDSFLSLVRATDLALNCLKRVEFRVNKQAFVFLYKQFEQTLSETGCKFITPVHEDEMKEEQDLCIKYVQDFMHECEDFMDG